MHGLQVARGRPAGVLGARPARHARIFAPRTENRRRVVTMGLPIVPLFTIGYAFGAFKFWSGFSRTTYDDAKKVQLTALWPILFVASEAFRKDFQRALKD